MAPNVISEEQQDLLNQFSRLAWGHPELFLKKEPFPGVGVVEFIELGEYFGAFEAFFARIWHYPRVLVRDEYHFALERLQSHFYSRGAYVIGHPGIGKSHFLLYFLVHCLCQKQAVALQLTGDQVRYALFTQEGVTIRSIADCRPIFNCTSFIWALCDSNHSSDIPSSIFVGRPDRIRVIQATFPKVSSWHGWSKQVGARPFVMDVWSNEELAKLAALLNSCAEPSNVDFGRITVLAEKWGGVPRTLLSYAEVDDWNIEDAVRGAAAKAVQECKKVMRSGVEVNSSDSASLFYFLRPKNTPPGVIPRLSFSVSIPTRTLRYILAEALQSRNHSVKVEFFRALGGVAETRQTARFIYESWFHSFFSAGGSEIKCKWVTPDLSRWPPGIRPWRDLDVKKKKSSTLQGSTNTISAPQAAPPYWTPPFYWIPPGKNAPGIDGVLVLEDGIFVIHVTVAREHHRSLEIGLSELSKLLPDNLKNLPWNVVFVGTDKHSTMEVAECRAGMLFFPARETCVCVGWTVVDPIQDGVAYKVFRDEESDECLAVDQ